MVSVSISVPPMDMPAKSLASGFSSSVGAGVGVGNGEIAFTSLAKATPSIFIRFAAPPPYKL